MNNTSSSVLDELLGLEHRGWESLCNGTGSNFYGELLTEPGAMIIYGGHVMPKAQLVGSLEGAPMWSGYRIEEPRLIKVNDDVSILIYRGVSWRENPDAPFVATMASTYVREGNDWRLALYQQTAVIDATDG